MLDLKDFICIHSRLIKINLDPSRFVSDQSRPRVQTSLHPKFLPYWTRSIWNDLGSAQTRVNSFKISIILFELFPYTLFISSFYQLYLHFFWTNPNLCRLDSDRPSPCTNTLRMCNLPPNSGRTYSDLIKKKERSTQSHFDTLCFREGEEVACPIDPFITHSVTGIIPFRASRQNTKSTF